MKQGVSSLNPYAASYVPLSKRESHGATSVAGTAFSFQSPPQYVAEDQHLLHSRTSASQTVPESFQVKSKPASSFYGSSQQNVAGFVDNLFPDEDPDMDVEFLRMQFPGISEESLRDVYMVNECDLDAAVDMLNQLELKVDGVDGVESSGSLPETLDIGDVSESGLSSDSASLKLKYVAAEASTSSSSNSSANAS